MTVIEKRHLLVTHSDSSEQDLEFLVLVLPKEGSLLVGNEKLTADGEMTFTQADINNGNLKYKPETMTATSDQFVFEVSNGLEALRGLEFLINIVPYSLSMSVQNFTVIEGGQKALSTQIITVDTKLSQNQSLVFSVKHPPTFGRIEADN
ncbi:hypothetical protein DPMN_110444 [Dreissena polymorpha]|uniref:Uncharacterized protein n=1 Tax=Dreissena polymorpha TaxID=45954 RepID=A0A9D4KCE0_DREPO|nr:hypothetical protein DPMN_110444 [Dreissena polymorpha]